MWAGLNICLITFAWSIVVCCIYMDWFLASSFNLRIYRAFEAGRRMNGHGHGTVLVLN
jgi:hypothetical protein